MAFHLQVGKEFAIKTNIHKAKSVYQEIKISHWDYNRNL